MLLGTEVSAGWVDKAAARVNAQLKAAGFDDAMIAALAAEDVLAADETPVNVLDKSLSRPRRRKRRGEAGPEETDGKTAAGAPHVLIVRTPDGRQERQPPVRGAARADRSRTGRAADVPAGSGLPPQGQRRRRGSRRVRRIPDHRRLYRLPAPPFQDRGHPAVRPARD